MLTLHTKIPAAETIAAKLVLPFDLRVKSRLRTVLDTGEEAAVLTVRGTVLRHGDLLKGDDGRVVQVVAAPEATYRVSCENGHALLRCAYHLGNRHTQVEVGDGYLRILADGVLRDMLAGLGASVLEETSPFEPESGAYGGGHHGHAHSHLLAPVPVRQKIHRPEGVR